MWISISFGVLPEAVFITLVFVIMLIITLLRMRRERAGTNKESDQLKSYPGFVANILAMLLSLVILYLLSFSRKAIRYFDHGDLRGISVLILFSYFLVYFVFLKLIRKASVNKNLPG